MSKFSSFTILGSAIAGIIVALLTAPQEAPPLPSGNLSPTKLPVPPLPEAASLSVSDALSNTPPGELRNRLHEIFSEWAERDPQAAWEAVQSTLSEEQRYSMQAVVIDEWFAADPVAAAEFLTQPGISFIGYGLASIIDQLVKLDPSLAIEWTLRSADPPGDRTTYDELAMSLASAPPDKAIAAYETGFFLKAENPTAALARFAGMFSSTHPEAALRWVKSYDGQDVSTVLSRVAQYASMTHPEETFALLEEIQIPNDELGKFSRTLHALALHDLDRYLSIFAKAPPKVANEAVGSAARKLAENGRHPESAELLALAGFEQEEIGKEAQKTVTDWARTDPPAAAAWVSSLPERAGKTDLTRNLVDQWVRHDRQAAIGYTASLPEHSTERQHAAFALAERLAASDPDESVRWLEEVHPIHFENKKFSWGRDLLPLVSHAPEALKAHFPHDEQLHQHIENDHAWRTYLETYLKDAGAR